MDAILIDDPAISFLQTIWALDHRLQSHSKKMKSATGVTGPQRLVLRLISMQPKISPSDLARALFFHKSTITIVLRSLEAQKLVKRVPNPDDRRGFLLTLTARGESIARKKTGTVEAAVRAVLSKMAANDVRAARKALDALAEELG